MTVLHRARIGFVVAVFGAVVLVVVEFPLGELLHQRSELASVTSQLSTVQSRNAVLKAQVSSLHERATIAAIAHSEYGLVNKGQRSIVVLPSATADPGSANTLANRPLPASDLVPGDAGSLLIAPAKSGTSAPPPTEPSGGLWSRVADRLAFWRWAF